MAAGIARRVRVAIEVATDPAEVAIAVADRAVEIEAVTGVETGVAGPAVIAGVIEVDAQAVLAATDAWTAPPRSISIS